MFRGKKQKSNHSKCQDFELKKMLACITFDDVCLGFLSIQEFKKFVSNLQELSVASTLFVVPNKTGNNSDEETAAYADYLKKLASSGHEIGQHGNAHSGNPYFGEFGCLLPIPYPSYKHQKKMIENGAKELQRLTGIKPKSFRAPFYLHNSKTLKALFDLGFEFDSSKGVFKPAHLTKFRFQAMSTPKPFKVNGILEVPVTGDYTYRLNEMGVAAALEIALKDFDMVKKHDGIFVLNNHPNIANIDAVFSFLKTFVSRVSGETYFIRLKDAGNSAR
jgi:peptidoglycan-N-acetylglucosamine deacetylase